MSVLKSFLIWLLRVLCVTAIVGLVYVATLLTTLLDRSDVKQWISASGTYDDGKLVSALFSNESIETPDPVTSTQNLVSIEMVKTATEQVFDKQFLQTSFDTVVDSSYDWMEGKQATFNFSVPINAKRDSFIAELSKETEIKVAELPVCSKTTQDLCRPASVPTPSFAQQIVSEAVDQSDYLKSPLTEATFTTAAQGQDTTILQRLPQIRSAVSILLYVLPFVVIFGALGAVLLSDPESRLKLFIKISRAVFSSMLLALVVAGGVLVLQQTGHLPIEQLLQDAGPLAPIMAAFVNHMISGFAWALIMFAGITLVISIASWILFHFINKRQRHPSEEPVSFTPTAPYPPHEPQAPSL